jgi:hypothetical protein
MSVEYVDAAGVRQSVGVVNGQTTITGIAPLLVEFDASYSRAPTAFAQQSAIADPEAYAFLMLGYRINYGESLGGSWRYPAGRNASRDEDTGPPLFSRVFMSPGTRQVRLKVRDVLGNESTLALTVVVSPPPTGVLVATSAGRWPTFASNTRYLVQAGGDYRSFGKIDTGGLHNVIFEKTGTGADPIVASFSPDGRSKFTATREFEPRARHIRLVNIDLGTFQDEQRGFEYVGVIGGVVRNYAEGAGAYFWHEGSSIIRSNVRYSRGLFLQGTEFRNENTSNGFVIFGSMRGFHARDTRFTHVTNGPTTYLMIRLYGAYFSLRNNLWFIATNGGSGLGTPISMLAIAGSTPVTWRSDDLIGPISGGTSADNYGYVGEKMIAQNNQFYAANSFVANGVYSSGGNPESAKRVYPHLVGMEDNVWYPTGDVAITIQNGQPKGRYAFWRNNRRGMGSGAVVTGIPEPPNALYVNDQVTANGPYLIEDQNSRPVPTSF